MDTLSTALMARWEPIWEAVPQAPSVPVLKGDCPSQVGDCLFACLGTWVNRISGHAERPPDIRRMRLMCCASLEPSVADMVLLDISTEDPRAERLKTEDLPNYMMERACWGCHSLLLLWLRTFNRIFHQNIAAVVAFSVTEKPHMIFADENAAETCHLAVCLWLEGKHYMLLANSPSKVVFDLKTQEWQTTLDSPLY